MLIFQNGLAISALEEVGPSGHFLGCNHTQLNFENAFWRSDIFDYKPFETWQEEGAKDTTSNASKRVKSLLENYIKPELDISIEEELRDYIKIKKDSMPDSFI